MNTKNLIERLEAEWDTGGFLGQLRLGKFAPDGAAHFLDLLGQIDIGKDEAVPKRALSLLWYIPSFLAWQRERVEERGGNVDAYSRFVTDVHNRLEEALGVP